MSDKYEMRNLRFNDTFAMSKILRKIGIRDKVKEITGNITTEGKTIEQVGKELAFSLAGTVIENLDKAEKEIDDFMGKLVGISGKEFGELDLDVSFEIMQQFKNQKSLSAFFQQAVK